MWNTEIRFVTCWKKRMWKGSSLPPTARARGPHFVQAGAASEVEVEEYLAAAESLAARALSRLDTLAPCDEVVDEDHCANVVIDTLGLRAYRRPLEEDDRSQLREVYDRARGWGGSHDDGLRLVLEALLISPDFLYRLELGDVADAELDTRVVPLTAHQIASRLSYLFWSSMPDQALFEAADDGRLATADGIEAEARRMLADTQKARAGVSRFHVEWLRLTNHTDPRGIRELELYSSYHVFEGEGSYEALMTSRSTFGDATLAALYGVGGGSDVFAPITLPSDQRAGLLTLSAVLAGHAGTRTATPIYRGVFVNEAFLCREMPLPGADLQDEIAAVPPDANPRETLNQLAPNERCASCHIAINPVGLAFEQYDTEGRFRLRDADGLIDPSGILPDIDRERRTVEDAVDLAVLVAQSDQAQDCFVRQWFRYAFGRGEAPTDDATLDTLQSEFQAHEGSVQELLIALVRAPAFRQITLSSEEH